MTKIMPLKEFSDKMIKKFDLFICSSSFEERCISISSKLNSTKIGKIFVVYNEEYEDHSRRYIDIQRKLFGNNSELIKISLMDPILTADILKENIITYIQNKRCKNILLDITTFTHESLLILLKLLALYCPELKITCSYVNAKEYSIGDEMDKKWLSKGIGEIRAILGYSGDLIPTQKTHLIIIVGYEYERAVGMINALEPNSLSLGYGKSENATVEKDREANAHYSQLIMQMAPSYPNINIFQISCNDPYDTVTSLKKIVKNIKNENILIAPMNNKISTIGVGLLALQNHKIRICYGPALSYNILNYSTPGELCYVFDIEIYKKDAK